MLIQITTGLAILGALYVASGRALAALVFHNLYNGQIEQAIMFMVNERRDLNNETNRVIFYGTTYF